MKSKVNYSVTNLIEFAKEYFKIPQSIEIQIIENDKLLRRFSTNDLDIRALSYKPPIQNIYQIFIQKSCSKDLVIIAHEMVHIWQYVRGDLDLDLANKVFIWKCNKFKASEISYEDRPWEQEAFDLEQTLYSAYRKFEKAKVKK